MAFRANMNSQFAKTKMCKFELIGCCLKGTSCQFAHSESEMQSLPDLSKTKLCPAFIKNGVCDVPGCTFAHDKVEIRATHAFHKTKMCRFFPSGRCERGSSCTFAHAADEIKPQAVPESHEMDLADNLQARPKQQKQGNEKANATVSMLTGASQENKLVPTISQLIDRLGNMQVSGKKLTCEMMEAETETQYSDSEGHMAGTSTPTSSEDDQLIGEAINAHQPPSPSRTIHLFPFIAQKSGVPPPPGLELYNDGEASLPQDSFARQLGSTWQPDGPESRPSSAFRTIDVVNRSDISGIWEADNIFCDL